MQSQEIAELQKAIEGQTEAAKQQAFAEQERAKAELARAEEIKLLRKNEEERIRVVKEALRDINHILIILNSYVLPAIRRTEDLVSIILEIQRLIMPRLLEADNSDAEIERLIELLKSVSKHDLHLSSERDINIDGDVESR